MTTKKPQHAEKPHFPQAVRDDGLLRGWANSLSQVGEFFVEKDNEVFINTNS